MMAVSHARAGLYCVDPNNLGPREAALSGDSKTGGLKFVLSCEVCGRQVDSEGSAAEWVRATYCCPEHEAARAGRA